MKTIADQLQLKLSPREGEHSAAIVEFNNDRFISKKDGIASVCDESRLWTSNQIRWSQNGWPARDG